MSEEQDDETGGVLGQYTTQMESTDEGGVELVIDETVGEELGLELGDITDITISFDGEGSLTLNVSLLTEDGLTDDQRAAIREALDSPVVEDNTV